MSSGQRSTPAAATTETNPQVNNKLFVPHRATRHEPQPAPRLERQGPWQRLGPRRARQVAQLSVAPPIAVPPQQAPPAPKRPHRAAPAPRLAPTPRTQRIQRLPARVGGWRRGRGCRRGSRSRPPQGRRPHRRPGGRPSTPIATSQRPRQTAPGLSVLAKRPCVQSASNAAPGAHVPKSDSGSSSTGPRSPRAVRTGAGRQRRYAQRRRPSLRQAPLNAVAEIPTVAEAC